MMLHALYSIIYPKYSKHGQRKVTIPQKMTLIIIAKAFGYTYRDILAIAEDLKEVLGIRRVTTFRNFNHFARRIKPQELQDAIEFSAAILIKLDRGDERVILIDSTGFQIMDALSYYNYIVSADSAYSSSEAYMRIRDELDAIPAIKPSKGRGIPRGLKALFWEIRKLPWFRHYANLRWVPEAMFKVFKRFFGWFVRGKSQGSRANEVLFKALAWNIMPLVFALVPRLA